MFSNFEIISLIHFRVKRISCVSRAYLSRWQTKSRSKLGLKCPIQKRWSKRLNLSCLYLESNENKSCENNLGWNRDYTKCKRWNTINNADNINIIFIETAWWPRCVPIIFNMVLWLNNFGNERWSNSFQLYEIWKDMNFRLWPQLTRGRDSSGLRIRSQAIKIRV